VSPSKEDETAISTNETPEIGEDELPGPGALLLALEHLSARSPEEKKIRVTEEGPGSSYCCCYCDLGGRASI
jgi:hypothetical protein